jgi:hypothetical protein
LALSATRQTINLRLKTKGSEDEMQVVCAWCGGILSGTGGPVSHGICASCSMTVERAFLKSQLAHRGPARLTLKRRGETLPLPGFSAPGLSPG